MGRSRIRHPISEMTIDLVADDRPRSRWPILKLTIAIGDDVRCWMTADLRDDDRSQWRRFFLAETIDPRAMTDLEDDDRYHPLDRIDQRAAALSLRPSSWPAISLNTVTRRIQILVNIYLFKYCFESRLYL
jgi:hypothetical protein